MLSAFLMVFGILTSNAQGSEKGPPKTPPSAKEILKQMDDNKDGKLSEAEVKGPLKEDFNKIDTDEDGFISKKELEKAPKPKCPESGKRKN